METNREIMFNLYDAWNCRDWDRVAKLIATDAEWLHVARDEKVRGNRAVVSLLRSVAESFPTAVIHVIAIHEAEGVVIAECTFTDPRLPAASAKGVRATFCEVAHFANGRLVQGSTFSDMLRMLNIGLPVAA